MTSMCSVNIGSRHAAEMRCYRSPETPVLRDGGARLHDVDVGCTDGRVSSSNGALDPKDLAEAMAVSGGRRCRG